jgi:hypothetical protein
MCGCAAPLVAIGTDLAASAPWSGYDAVSRSASGLTAVGAPTGPYVLAALLVSDALIVVFGLGVSGVAADSRALRVIGGLVVAKGVLGARDGRMAGASRRARATIVVERGRGGRSTALPARGDRHWRLRLPELVPLPHFRNPLPLRGAYGSRALRAEHTHIRLQERVMAYLSVSCVLVLAALLLRPQVAEGSST